MRRRDFLAGTGLGHPVSGYHDVVGLTDYDVRDESHA